MKKQLPEEPFLRRVKAELDQAQQQLKPDTLRDLRLARANAVQSLGKDRWRWPAAAVVASAAMIVTFVIALQLWQPTEIGAGLEDLPLLSASEEFELYEDLEFYQWLAFEQPSG